MHAGVDDLPERLVGDGGLLSEDDDLSQVGPEVILPEVDEVREGVEYQIGDIIDIPEANVSKWVAKGWGEVVEKKEAKIKKETKELKVKKETK